MAAAQMAIPAGDAKVAASGLAPRKPRASARTLLLIAAPAALALLCAGLWFTGVLPDLLGMGGKLAAAAPSAAAVPVFVEIPELVSNLNVGDRRDAYVKLRARIELEREADRAAVLAAMPRLQDLFQTFLREMRPEELRGAEGTWRLREELLARANVAVAPAKVTNVLFTELLVQ